MLSLDGRYYWGWGWKRWWKKKITMALGFSIVLWSYWYAPFHALGNALFTRGLAAFLECRASPAGMNVLIGGESGIPDDLLVRNAMSATFPRAIWDTQPVQAVTTANSANQNWRSGDLHRQRGCAQAVANNENRTKPLSPGTPATNSAHQRHLRSREDCASNPYEVIAEYSVNAGATTILTSTLIGVIQPLADGRV